MFVFTLDHRAHRNHIGQRLIGGHQARVGKQRIGQRLQTRLTGQLAFGAALELERQVQVFQLLFGSASVQRSQQLRREFALLVYGFGDHHQAVTQLAQVT